MESRLLFYGVWGVGVLVAFFTVVVCRAYVWNHRHDKRSFRELLEGAAFALVALGASAATAAFALFPEASTLRGFLTALALGAFFGAGIIMATDALDQFLRVRKERAER